MDEQRLPFPIHGTRLTGDGDPQRGVGEAARLLYFANLIAQTAGVPVYRLSRQTPYGQVTASAHGPLAFKTVHSVAEPEELPPEEEAEAGAEAEEVTGIARLVWLPEGFVITPRTAGAPDGFGMPPTPDGKGTPGGPLKQVIINRFKDNQYPDAVYRWGMEQAGMNPGAGQVVTGNLFMMDWELDKESGFGIGIVLPADGTGKSEFLPQFDKRWVPNYAEPDSGEWHCHRPMPAHESEQQLRMRLETNLLREEVGRPPFGAMLRGRNGWLSSDVVYQMKYSGIYGHGSRKFRVGHQEFLDRTRRDGWHSAYNENIMFRQGADPESLDFAVDAVAGWRSSPPHYAAIIEDFSYGGTSYESVESWAGGAVFTATQPPPYALDTPTKPTNNPTAESAAMAQIIEGTDTFVFSMPGTHSDRAPVGVVNSTVIGETGPSDDMMHSIYPYSVGDYIADRLLTYRGRYIVVAEQVPWRGFRILSATTLVEDGEEVALRMAVLLSPSHGPGPTYLAIYSGKIHDFLATRVEVGRFLLPSDDASQIATPRWSASGKKLVFSYSTLNDVPPGRVFIDDDKKSSDGQPSGVTGQKIHFVEFADGAFSTLREDELIITPLNFGYGFHSQECKDTCALLAAYQDETVVFAIVSVDGESSQKSGKGGLYHKKFKGTLTFPDGTSLVYADIHTSAGVPGAPNAVAVHGFFRHLLPFDIMDSEGVAYLQYDFPEDMGSHLTAKLMILGTEVKTSANALNNIPGMHGASDSDLKKTGVTTMGAYNHSSFSFDAVTSYGGAYPPSVPHAAVVASWGRVTAAMAMPRGPQATNGPVMRYVMAGPTILAHGMHDPNVGHQHVEEFQYAKYKSDWIYAGRIQGTVGRIAPVDRYIGGKWVTVKMGAWPEEEDQYYYHSSLDLKAITGLPDLKDNIMPIGVL